MTLDEAAAKAAGLPCWTGPVDPRPVSGGITNTNFRIDDGGRSYMVRIGGNIPVHGIRRTYETACSRAAHAVGVAPEVIFTSKGALVLDWIEGKTFGEADVRDPANLERIIKLLDRLHRDGARHLRGRAPLFWVFHVVRDYGHRMVDDEHRLQGEVPRLVALADELETAVGPVDLALCHNDLLPANFMDDGRRLWLVDWEYAGYDTPLFDLANLASNNQMDAAQRDALMAAVWDRAVTDEDRRRLGAMMCASLLREAMWSMVQEVHSTLDVDYVAYTVENSARFQQALADWRQGA
ncbi:MAG: choline kinase family protein [Alphaproteobacteria bacterium]|jgi:thiamine kinase-like enzyme|nr:phosphotransferase [Rhodospirillaceae bacterium]MDG2482516.1 choline kinase family protein [Alphaproteobacteria bacterium]MBT6203556.1 phosphotransferase [Rhodospirillaceae bacterium]MBT6511937.1 phosphotransferase [Rhodospirillaceae bacterium]MBT7613197.1 phosphotransferase [Rhodospirillaceae bacterium]